MNKKGVTLTVLVVTIVVMLIIFGITYTTSLDLLKNSQKNKMKTMLYMVQSRAEILLDSFMFDNDGKIRVDSGSIVIVEGQADKINYSVLGGSEITSASSLSGVGLSTLDDTKYIYRSWDKTTLEDQGIDTQNLAKGDTIIVQYDIVNNEVDVASTKGTSVDGKNYHFLSEFEDD